MFIGHSEAINREETKFKYIRPAVYRKSSEVELCQRGREYEYWWLMTHLFRTVLYKANF